MVLERSAATYLPYLAAYVLHLTASAIVFLSQCDEKQ